MKDLVSLSVQYIVNRRVKQEDVRELVNLKYKGVLQDVKGPVKVYARVSVRQVGVREDVNFCVSLLVR